MKKLHPSVRQWVLSFLVADVAFWLWLAVGCSLYGDCLDAFTFGPYLFYFPVVLLLDGFTSVLRGMVDVPFFVMLALITLLGVTFHALVGAGFGWLLRERKIRWLVSVPLSLALLWGVGYVTMTSTILRNL